MNRITNIAAAAQAAAPVKGMTSTGLALLIKAGMEQASKSDAFMVRDFLKQAETTATTDVFGAIKEFAKKDKGTWEQVGLRYESAKVYASGFRNIIGAVRYAKYPLPEGLGFNPAVAECRDALKAAGIKPNGERILSDDEKKRAESGGLLVDAAELRRDLLNKTGEDIGEAEAMKRVSEQSEVQHVRKAIFRLFETAGKEPSATYMETLLAELQFATETATHKADWLGVLRDWAGVRLPKAERAKEEEASRARQAEEAKAKAERAAKRAAKKAAKVPPATVHSLADLGTVIPPQGEQRQEAQPA